MALEWLKTILGEVYTEEIDAKVSEAIAGTYADKADLEKIAGEKAALEQRLSVSANNIASANADTGNLEKERAAAADWKKKYEDTLKAADDDKFGHAFDMAVLQSRGRNAGAIKGALGTKLEELRSSEDVQQSLKAALDELAKESSYLFEQEQVKEPYSPGAGTADLKPDNKPVSLQDALQERIYGKKGI